jgi:hypothetical protein
MANQEKNNFFKTMMTVIGVIWAAFFAGGPALAAPTTSSPNPSLCDMQAAARVMGAAFSWDGACRDTLPAGRGMAKFTDGRVYAGEMMAGLFEGNGTLNLPAGARYTGEFSRGAFQGQGVYTFPNGDRYVGGFEAGLMHGTGIYRRAGGSERYQVEYARGEQVRFELEAPAVALLDEPVLSGVIAPVLRRLAKVHHYILHTLGLTPTYTSGYRDPVKNSAVGGALHSRHLMGRAVDLVVAGITPEQERMVAEYATEQGLWVLWHGEGDNYHLHLQMDSGEE